MCAIYRTVIIISERLSNATLHCGHCIDADGLHKTQAKMRAIMEAPVPRDVSQLRAFLGLVNYYNRFLSNLANTLAPLHRLLQKNTKGVGLRNALSPSQRFRMQLHQTWFSHTTTQECHWYLLVMRVPTVWEQSCPIHQTYM